MGSPFLDIISKNITGKKYYRYSSIESSRHLGFLKKTF
jgi:hypothetical protein